MLSHEIRSTILHDTTQKKEALFTQDITTAYYLTSWLSYETLIFASDESRLGVDSWLVLGHDAVVESGNL